MARMIDVNNFPVSVSMSLFTENLPERVRGGGGGDGNIYCALTGEPDQPRPSLFHTHYSTSPCAQACVDGKYHTEYKDEAAERLREIVITQLAESRAGT